MGPNCKTSRKFIGVTKKSMVKNHHQNILEILSKKNWEGKADCMKSAWKSRFFTDIRS